MLAAGARIAVSRHQLMLLGRPIVNVAVDVSDPIRSTMPCASEVPVSGWTSWYFSDDEPELRTRTVSDITSPRPDHGYQRSQLNSLPHPWRM